MRKISSVTWYNISMKKFLRIALNLSLVLGILLVVFIFYFNRTPERIIPEGNTIVSPANGEVIHIEKVSGNEVSFFKKDVENKLTVHEMEPPYTVVVIEMDLKDIHAQRAPIDGEIIYQEHFDGEHRNALSSENVEYLSQVNEKNVVVFQKDDLEVGVVQVAGLMARRIQSFVETGDVLAKGDKYGRILLGSQVVIILPREAVLLSEVGDVLIDGESVVATY